MISLCAGGVLVALAISPPASTFADSSLTGHMIRHLVLLQIAPLLIVLGGMHVSWRAGAAWVAGVAAMALWYAPPLFMWAMATPGHRSVELATLIAAGVAFWSPVFSNHSAGRLQPGPAIAYLFTACLASTITGASIAFASPGLFGGRAISATDQHVAGLVMWVPCCVVYVGAIMATLAQWYGGAGDDPERSRMARTEA